MGRIAEREQDQYAAAAGIECSVDPDNSDDLEVYPSDLDDPDIDPVGAHILVEDYRDWTYPIDAMR